MTLRSLFDRPPLQPPPPESDPAAEPEPCRCGCVALRVRNAHLEDKVRRLEAVLAGDGALQDDDTDRQRAAQRNWPAWAGAGLVDTPEPKP
ncbi:MAG TPA: hypothetical protein VD764_08990 [Nocardioides sp.]|nr:hypothetical protein [Nocardioides sp.]